MRRQLAAVWPLYWNRFGSDISKHLLDDCMIRVDGLARESEIETFNMLPKLGQIEIPTLIVVGRNDFIVPLSQAQALNDGIPHSELIIFEQSGPFPFAEEAQKFFACVRAWIRRAS